MLELINKHYDLIIESTNPTMCFIFSELGILNFYLAEKRFFKHKLELFTYLLISPFIAYGLADYLFNNEGYCNIIVLSYVTGQMSPKLIEEIKKLILTQLKRIDNDFD